MVIQKTAVYKILAIVLALSLFLGSSERVAAAEGDFQNQVGVFMHEGNTYYYSYVDKFVARNTTYYFSVPVYVVCNTNGIDARMLVVSKSSFWFSDDDYRVYNPTDAVSHYYYAFTNDIIEYTLSLPLNYYYDPDTLTSVFRDSYINNSLGDFVKPFEPDFYNSIGEDSIFTLDNFQCDIVDGNLVMVWEQPKHMPYRLMKNMFIQFQYAHRDPEAYQVGRVKYIDLNQYAKVSDGTITIPLSEIDTLPDNHQVSSIVATPYYYYADDLESGEMVRGQSSQVYFDINGLSSAPILVNPDIKEEIPEENVEQNIFQSVNNFFSGFFRNLQNTIKSAVVPSGDDVLALLQEMNDWFSERFGFIWYPFDLAIDIVGAFALGDADSKITVPALTLNMLGGIKLWDSFEADLDPIGFLEYVRFFTSAIMCCGTVSLAIRKWDEWIGGEH